MKNLLLTTGLFLFTIVGFTQSIQKNGFPFDVQLNTITTAVPSLRIVPDARSAAMGDAGLAISPDANSIYYNTSKLAFSDKRAEFSTSYSPWMRHLVGGMHHAYFGGYAKLGDRQALTAAVRYFSVGSVSFFSSNGNLIQEFSPTELESVVGYAVKLGRKSAFGINGKFIYSDLAAGGVSTGTVNIRPELSGAVDLSYSYVNEDLKIAGKKITWSLATTVANLGNKMAYTEESGQDFLPTNLGIGTALKVAFNDNHKLSAVLDFNKMLVPTPPVLGANGQILSGRDNNVGVALGIIQSFYDAPGNVSVSPSGAVNVQKGSRLKEELNEITIGGGFEYVCFELLKVRAGYYHQHRTKGPNQYATAGVGLLYKGFGLDFSYLATFNKLNPLANTMRLTLRYTLS